MMLATIFTRTVDDRWRGTAISALTAGLVLLGAMAAYSSLDLSIYNNLPEAMRALMGIPDGADPAALSYAVGFGLIAAMTLAGLSVSMGASTIAGEERDGTVGLLLGNPKSRRDVVVAKTAAMIALTAIAAFILLVAGLGSPRILGVTIGSAAVGAQVLHMLLNALLWGMLAVAVGAMTGNRALASGLSAGVMVASYFFVGLLPLFSWGVGIAKVLPWYWFDGHNPINNGVDGWYLLLQIASIAVLATVAWAGVVRRDLRKPMSSAGLVDRLRDHPVVGRILARTATGASVARIWTKTATESRTLLTITAALMFGMMGLLMGPMYAALESTLVSFSSSLPENLMAMFGGADMSTPEGWYQTETLGLMAPIAVVLVAANIGAKALAGEEQRRTMGLLLANPIPRSRVVLEKAFAMLLQALVVGFATFAGIAGGSLVAGLGMSIPNIAATSLLVTLLGVMFGAVALALSAATGNVRTAVMGTVGVVGVSYAVNAILSISESFAPWLRLSPFHWYLGSDPLVNGMSWSDAALFLTITAILIASAVVLFDRRDLRRS